jgi:hypothetical protein
MKRRLLAPEITALFALLMFAASLYAQKPQADKKLLNEVEVPAAAEAKNVRDAMETTREEFLSLLRLHPRLLGAVYHDPSLLAEQDYMKRTAPDLAALIAKHPEITQNAEFFLGSEVQLMHDNESLGRFPSTRNPTERLMEFLGPFTVLVFIVGVLIWIVKFFTESRRWNKMVKVQQEVHSKLMDKFSSSQDLQAYMQTEAGRRFLESAPIPIEPEQKSRISAPLGRILWSVQVGVILAMGSLGLILARTYVPEAAQPLKVFGTLGLMLGLGFVLAAGASYALSRQLGLFDSSDRGPAA